MDPGTQASYVPAIGRALLGTLYVVGAFAIMEPWEFSPRSCVRGVFPSPVPRVTSRPRFKLFAGRC